MQEAPWCVTSNHHYLLSDCGSTIWGLVVFLLYQVLVTLFVVNLFIATIIGNFDLISQSDATYALLTGADLKSYKQAWAELDPKGTGYLPREQLVTFLHVR